MSERHCRTCRFFRTEIENDEDGTCQRWPPVPLSNESQAQFPVVAAGDWCGEWSQSAQ